MPSGKSPQPAEMLVVGEDILEWIIQEAENEYQVWPGEQVWGTVIVGLTNLPLTGLFSKRDWPEYWRRCFQNFLYKANESMRHKR